GQRRAGHARHTLCGGLNHQVDDVLARCQLRRRRHPRLERARDRGLARLSWPNRCADPDAARARLARYGFRPGRTRVYRLPPGLPDGPRATPLTCLPAGPRSPHTIFFYNNPGYAAAGYLPLLVQGTGPDALQGAYGRLMQERVYGPAGMGSAR